MKRLAVAVMFVVAAAGCGPQTRADQVVAMTGTASAGQALFMSTCASCHGTDGKGTASGVDLWEPTKNDSATEVINTMINGKPGTTMASYKGFTDQQLADIYAYMKATFK